MMKKTSSTIIAVLLAASFSTPIYADDKTVTTSPPDNIAPAENTAPAENATPPVPNQTNTSKTRRPTRMEMHEQVRQYREAIRLAPPNPDAVAPVK